MKKFLSILVLGLCTHTAQAEQKIYNLDTHHTFVSFEYNHLGYSLQRNRFDQVNGSVTLDRAAKTGSADIQIDMQSLNTGSSVFNQHLLGEDFFDAKKFPTITFKSNDFKFSGDTPSEINGLLTIKGITKPITLKVTQFKCANNPITKAPTCGANANVSIKRSDFNNGKYVPYVSDEVSLYVAIEATEK